MNPTDIDAEPRLLQNAVYIPEDDFYLVSTHRHDYVEWISKDGADSWALDGGNEYRRVIASSFSLEGTRVIDWSLTTNSPEADVINRLLWGTRGADGKAKLTYRPIAEFTLDHLRKIAETQSRIKGTMYERVIAHWAATKESERP